MARPGRSILTPSVAARWTAVVAVLAAGIWWAAGSRPPAPAGLRGALLAPDGSPLVRRTVIFHSAGTPDGVESIQQSVRTTAEGAFAFNDVPPGDVELQIPDDPSTYESFSLGTFHAVSFRHDGRKRIVRLPGGVRVAGTVAGRRPAALRMRVGLSPLDPARETEPVFVGSVPAGPDGRFRFDAVPPGRYVAVAWQEWPGAPLSEGAPPPSGPTEGGGPDPAGGPVVEPKMAGDVPRESCYVTVRKDVDVRAAPVELALRFADGATPGRVPAFAANATAGPKPVGRANVLLLDAGPVRPAYAPRFLPDAACAAFVQADGEGRFEIPGLAPGRYLVRVTENTPEAAVVVERTVVVAPGAEIFLAR